MNYIRTSPSHPIPGRHPHHGAEGGAQLNPGSGEFTLSGQKFGEGFSIDVNPYGASTRRAMAEHFIECAKKGEQTIAPVCSGMVNNLILDAIYESARNCKSVDIDWSAVS